MCGSSGILAKRNSNTSWSTTKKPKSNSEKGGRDFAFSLIIQKVDGQAHLQLPCHAHNIVVGWVVLVAVGEHKPDVTSKLLSVPVFTTVHLPLMKSLEETKLVSKVSKVILWQ